jgi:hypothetical protein
VPVAGDRVAETGVEQIVKINRGNGKFLPAHSRYMFKKFVCAVPLIVVFTKYDLLVTSEIRRGDRSGSKEEVWQNAEEKANESFQRVCVDPLTEVVGNVPNTRVSGGLHHSFVSFGLVTLLRSTAIHIYD